MISVRFVKFLFASHIAVGVIGKGGIEELALQHHVSTVVLQIKMPPSSVKFKDLDEL